MTPMSRPSLKAIWSLAATTVLAATAVSSTNAHAIGVGDAVPVGHHPYTVKLSIGEEPARRGCSAVLVDKEWLATAASCFAPAGGKAASGKPTRPTIATLVDGEQRTVTELKVHDGRDLALARLDRPTTGIKPVPLADKLVDPNDLTVIGYGRTESEWVPERMRKASPSLLGTTSTTFAVGNAPICPGDAGGPVIENGRLVGISSRSTLHFCLGNPTATVRGEITRTDNIKDWIDRTAHPKPIPKLGPKDLTQAMTLGDFNGNGRADIAAVTKDGNLHAFYARKDGTYEYGRPLWKLDHGWRGIKKIVAGDFNGDKHTDIAAVWGDGSLHFYAGQADGTLAEAKRMWPGDNSWGTMRHIARFKADGSGRDGLAAVWADGSLYAYHTGKDGILTQKKRKLWHHDKSWNKMRSFTTGDFNGDGRDDVVAVTSAGWLVRWDGNRHGELDKGVNIWRDPAWSGITVFGGDVDGDGRTDLLGHWDTTFKLYRGDGKGRTDDGKDAWPHRP
ncbi:FG-GAP-like repeat-containing protein [Streptomyces melanogenes]|uniref:FG-GAP-like repeat-containing protein n=1 Tax=Streptomyces melanogenes TaxID=67326 RepID=UPI00378785C1